MSELSIITIEDTRKREDAPLFPKSLLECPPMRQEIACAETAQGFDLRDLGSGRVPPLAETPVKWILTIAQRYVADFLFLPGYYIFCYPLLVFLRLSLN